MKKNIILIGMPGGGKSTVGPLLAAKLGIPAVDVDALMAPSKKALQQLVDTLGCEEFLALEEKTLLGIDALAGPRVIITGGSAIFGAKAMAYHAGNGIFVYLDVPLDLLRTRVNFEGGGLAKTGGQSLEDVYRQRLPYYEKYADIKIATGRRSPEEVVEAILTELGRREDA